MNSTKVDMILFPLNVKPAVGLQHYYHTGRSMFSVFGFETGPGTHSVDQTDL